MSVTAKKWGLLLILSLIWGSSFILIKKGLLGFTPLQLGALRIVLTSLILFLFGFNALKKQTKSTLKWIAISGFLGTFFPAFLFAFAETQIDSAVASILNSLVPLNTVIIGLVLFQYYFSRKQLLGVFIGLLGTVLLIVSGANINPNQNYMYALLVLAATLMYGVNVNIIKLHLQEVSPIVIAVGNFAFIFIPALLVLIFSGFFNHEVLQAPVFTKSLFYIFLLSLFGTAIAKILFNKLVQLASPVFASSVTYIMPIIAVIWGFLDGETFSIWQGFATILILLGVYLGNSK
jgi:drug/metabolite transporter (DMT)-like permease